MTIKNDVGHVLLRLERSLTLVLVVTAVALAHPAVVLGVRRCPVRSGTASWSSLLPWSLLSVPSDSVEPLWMSSLDMRFQGCLPLGVEGAVVLP